VHIWDLRPLIESLNGKGGQRKDATKPLHTFSGHPTEGFAMDWSPVSNPGTAGRLLTGDCDRFIYSWSPVASAGGAGWQVDKIPLQGHTDSVEDIQWSPTRPDVCFCACARALESVSERACECEFVRVREVVCGHPSVLLKEKKVFLTLVCPDCSGSHRALSMEPFNCGTCALAGHRCLASVPTSLTST
jgi:WD40 repeat protein